MTRKQKQSDHTAALAKVCATCGRAGTPLQRCCLTGRGDHPRYFLLCDDCVREITAKSSPVECITIASPTMSEAEKRYETRRQNRFDKLGTDHPICACCPETDWRCMEVHHLEGERFGKTLINVCRNCHRKLSDMQFDHPQELGAPPTTIESIGHFLMGLADLFLLLAGKLWEFGEYLIEQARNQMPKTEPRKS
jgi:hypothetical protein